MAKTKKENESKTVLTRAEKKDAVKKLIKELFEYADGLPVYVTNYRYGFNQNKKEIAGIIEAADRLLKVVDERSYNDFILDDIARTIKDKAAKLNQE